jgi:hypothetical protein
MALTVQLKKKSCQMCPKAEGQLSQVDSATTQSRELTTNTSGWATSRGDPDSISGRQKAEF